MGTHMNFERTVHLTETPQVQIKRSKTWYRPWVKASWHVKGCELTRPADEKSEKIGPSKTIQDTLPGRYCRSCTLVDVIKATHILQPSQVTLLVLSTDGVRNNTVSHTGAQRLKELGNQVFDSEPAQTAYGPVLVVQTNPTCAAVLSYNLACVVIPEKIDNYTTEIFLNQLYDHIPLVAGYYSEEPFDAGQLTLLEKAWNVAVKLQNLQKT